MQSAERPAHVAFDVSGLVGWVTGASGGLGRSIVMDLASAGATVIATSRDASAVNEVARGARALGSDVVAVVGSVTDEQHLTDVVATARAEFGQLDFVVNNAGVSPSYERAERVDRATWAQILDTNLTAPFAVARAAHEMLAESEFGSIVNISSIHGRVAHERIAAYASSKGGLELLTRSLALEWAAHDIRVNAVAPGYLATDMTRDLLEHQHLRDHLLDRIPLRRFAGTGEIAPAVRFLVSSASSYVTGCTITVDGGWTAG